MCSYLQWENKALSVNTTSEYELLQHVQCKDMTDLYRFHNHKAEITVEMISYAGISFNGAAVLC